MSNSVLIELRTEELPPKALSHLGEVFKDEIFNGLVRCQLSQRVPANVSWFATPRRLAVSVREVETTAADRVEEMKLMPVSVALDANGQPTQALRKKLEASGIPVSEIAKFETRMDGKAQALFYKATVKGVDLDAVLAGIVTQALKKLPIQKVMRWGDSEDQFVRPVHSLIMLHGTRVVPGTVLGLTSGNKTLGHRFLSSGDIVIENPEEYAAKLEAGKVIASFAERRASIAAQLDVKAAELNARLNPAEGSMKSPRWSNGRWST